MTRYVTLTTVSDEHSNEPGFKLANTPNFAGFLADRSGSSIAHDIVEHQNGPKAMGPVWDELEALGGVWYCRGQFGFPDRRNSYHSPEISIAADITYMFQEWAAEHTPAVAFKSGQFHYQDELFLEIIDIARNDIPKESDSDWADSDNECLEVYLDLALQCLRRGYRKASKRWQRDHDGMFAYRTYSAIKEAVAKAGKDIEIEGQEFVLAYGDGEARCYPKGQGDGY